MILHLLLREDDAEMYVHIASNTNAGNMKVTLVSTMTAGALTTQEALKTLNLSRQTTLQLEHSKVS